jgi:hypothetical protein
MKKQKLDVEGILNTLASFRQQVPYLSKTPAKAAAKDTAGMAAFVPDTEEAMELFEMETLAEALESFAGELTESVETAHEELLSRALEVYYTAEELAKDPEHAHLIPLLEEMRESYRSDYGTEIPAKRR